MLFQFILRYWSLSNLVCSWKKPGKNICLGGFAGLSRYNKGLTKSVHDLMCNLAPLDVVVHDVDPVDSVGLASQGRSVPIVLVTKADVRIWVDVGFDMRDQPGTNCLSFNCRTFRCEWHIPDTSLGCVFHDSPGNGQPLFFGEMVWDFVGYPDQTVWTLFPLPAVIVGHLTRLTFGGGKDDVTFKEARALFRVAIIVHIMSKGCQ